MTLRHFASCVALLTLCLFAPSRVCAAAADEAAAAAADKNVSKPTDDSLPATEKNYDTTSPIGPHHQRHNEVVTITNYLGQISVVTNNYIELQTGLNYLDQGKWKPAIERIDIDKQGASAQFGQHKVKFSRNLKANGAIELTTSDGKVMRTQILGLSYFDAASGRSVLLAEVKEAGGELVGTNKLVYRDAFDDVKADVRFTYTKSGFEQDIIVLEAIPSPVEWGLNPETTRLEVLTEILEAPEPVKKGRVIKGEQDQEKRAQMAEADLIDEELSFGEMKMGAGKAFAIDGDQEDKANGLWVGKRWTVMDGRQFLVEAIDYPSVLPKIDELKQRVDTAKEKKKRQATNIRQLPKQQVAALDGTGMKISVAPYRAKGLVLDYNILNHTYNLNITNTSTFYASGDVMLAGTTRYDRGFIKAARDVSVFVNGPFLQMTTNSFLIVTGADDDSVGDAIPPYDSPSGYYANNGLNFQYVDTSSSLKNVRFRYAKVGLRYSDVAYGGMSHWLENARFQNCQTAVLAENTRVVMTNIMLTSVTTNYTGQGGYHFDVSGIRTDANPYFENGGSYIVSLSDAVDYAPGGFTPAYQNMEPWYGYSEYYSYTAVDSGMWNYPSRLFDGDYAITGTTYGVGYAALQKTVQGPGLVRFKWKSAIQAGDTLTFYINNEWQEQMTGAANDWIDSAYSLPEGSFVLKWRYAKNTTNCFSWEKCYVDNFSFITPTVANPIFSQVGGTYSTNVSLTMACATPSAGIFYTINGADPTTNSTLYTTPITISSSQVIRAKAFKSSMVDSGLIVASYVINSAGTVLAPVISPAGGNYDRPTAITLTSGTAGSSIYYTTNGSIPTTSSTLYTGPFTLTGSAMVRARAYKSGMFDSSEGWNLFNLSYQNLEETLDNYDLIFFTGGTTWSTYNWGGGPTFVDTLYTTGVQDNQTSYVQTAVSGPGTIAFRWEVSSAAGDKFKFFIDTVEQASISGNVSWQNERITVPPGVHTLKWAYIKDSSGSDLADEPGLDAVSFTPDFTAMVASPAFSPASGYYQNTVTISITNATAGSTVRYTLDGTAPTTNSTLYASPFVLTNIFYYGPVRAKAFKVNMLDSIISSSSYGVNWVGDFAEGVDNFDLVFQNYGNSWTRSTDYYCCQGQGYDSAQSPTLSAGQYTHQTTTVTGPGTISFWWLVSQDGYDILTFEIDGTTVTNYGSYAIGWDQKSIAVGSGTHTLRWRYERGQYASSSHTAWMDQIVFAPVAPSVVATPVITPSGGTFYDTTNVTITVSTPGATIYYAYRGELPGTNSQAYVSPFLLKYTATVRAFAVKAGMLDSAIASVDLVKTGTWFAVADNDNDGLRDSWEQTYFSTGSVTGWEDADADGRLDRFEEDLGLNPRKGPALVVFTKFK